MATTGLCLRLLFGVCGAIAGAGLVSFEILGQTYDPSLQYTRRGRHYEGLRTIPIAGNLQLLSARAVVNSQVRGPDAAAFPGWEEFARLRFHLPRADRVTITVRQLRSGSTYYLLDRVEGTWTPGSVNEYAWPTAPVLRKLTTVRPDDLGAVVNLGSGKDTNRETVLPAVLFDDIRQAGALRHYRFSLKTTGRVKVDAAIFFGAREVFRRPTSLEESGSPFTVVWPAPASAEGWYRLVLGGQYEDGAKIDKEVTFYHSRASVSARGTPR
jgi:hypothetical protein